MHVQKPQKKKKKKCVCKKNPNLTEEIVETLLLPWEKLKGTTLFSVHLRPSWGY